MCSATGKGLKGKKSRILANIVILTRSTKFDDRVNAKLKRAATLVTETVSFAVEEHTIFIRLQ